MQIIYVLLIFTLLSSESIGQNGGFWFYDACSKDVKELNYTIFNEDTVITVNNGESISIPTNGFILETSLTWEGKYTWFNFNLTVDSSNHQDTLYLLKTRSYSTSPAHPAQEKFKFYSCMELLDGKIIETDSIGTIRFSGEFAQGIPLKTLNYYNEKGDKIRTEYYKKGKLVKMKGYFPDSKNRP